ncbi:Threonine dehydrogenase [Nakamurella panacisegetis]|uniref:Threonine dehydrogenase n=1 Tax=Nakamurella panacisegetis TaxID=1090615 RepID=A0A1H0S5I4_9ACTN|nr:Threonine dehydrogenase [Nakamurella panacisegetis]
MKAVTWQGKRNVRVDNVDDPRLLEPTDAIVKITSTAICGSDLHLYEVLGPYMAAGDILGHEPMGIVQEVGSAVTNIAVGDRVVIPFNISCGHCWMCERGLQSQCETTQVRSQGKGAALFGYTSLYGSVPGGQAEYLRVPQAQYGPIKVSPDGPDEKYLFLSDVLPTAWQAVRYADVPAGGTLVVYGLGPVGQFASRIGRHLGYRVVAVEPVPERRAMAERHGVEVVDPSGVDDVPAALIEMTGGRGADAVIDAVGMEAHGSLGATVGKLAQAAAGLLPDTLAQKLIENVGVDRLTALQNAIGSVRRGGTVSISGVYGGIADPMPMMDLFDKQIQLRMGQCNVKKWIDDLLPLVEDGADPLGVLDLTTHAVSIDEAPEAYQMFQQKTDGCVKVVLKP